MAYRRSTRYPELFQPTKSPFWWAFFPNPAGGRKLRETSQLRDEKLAHEWYLVRVRGGLVPAVAPKGPTLFAALETRLEWLKANRKNDDATRTKLAKATIDFYEKKSLPLLAILGASTPLPAIGPKQIRGYIVKRSESVKGTTIAKELTTLSMAWRMAKKDGTPLPAFADIVPDDFAAKYVPKTRWLDEGEVEAFASVLNPKRVPLFLFLVCTGATYPSEVVPIRPGHVKTHVVHVPGTKASTRDRYVHVPSYGRKFLKTALVGLRSSGFEPWTNIRGDLHDAARLLSMCAPCRAASLAWARHRVGAKRPSKEDECKACKRTQDVAACSPNDLRRTFAQWLVRSGVPYELAAPMMGHGSTKMLERVYGRRDASAVADLVEMALKKAPKGARSRKAG